MPGINIAQKILDDADPDKFKVGYKFGKGHQDERSLADARMWEL